VLFAIFLLNIGCASNAVFRNVPFDKTEKTISISNTDSAIGNDLKRFFKSKGYKIIASSGGVKTEKISSEINVTTDLNNSRYDLVINDNRIDWCITGSEMIRFKISMIDNKTGEEVFSMSGRDCTKNVYQEILKEVGYAE
jgi:hypothetical protein